MTLLRSLAEFVGRIARLIAPALQPDRPLTEDDIRTDQYLRAHHARG